MARPLLHNPLHDTESIWWVGVWSIVSASMKGATGNYNPHEHLAQYLRMFPETIDQSSRIDFMLGNKFDEVVKVIAPTAIGPPCPPTR